MEEQQRPPIGVVPKEIWQHRRAVELSRAIHAYIDFGDFGPISEWTKELQELLNEMSEEE